MDLAQTFQGIGTMFYQDADIVIARIVLIILGVILVWLGKRDTLEPLIMLPMGLVWRPLMPEYYSCQQRRVPFL
jgi:Na+-transporting methylmalonyl-CoA/oxaloacetate decarboxylase beta subunit